MKGNQHVCPSSMAQINYWYICRIRIGVSLESTLHDNLSVLSQGRRNIKPALFFEIVYL
jgi:hypothetical protein